MKKGAVERELEKVSGSSQAAKGGKRLGITWGDQFVTEFRHKLDYAILGGASKAFTAIVQNVKELNSAQTELKKVSDLNGEALNQFTEKAYKMGDIVARTGTDMVAAATEWKKAGFDETEILKLSQVSSMYQNIADNEISAGDATNFIVSQLKAFNIEASRSEHIIDAVNNVSNSMAVSSYDLATNIGKASAAMSAGGNTYEETLGLTK